MLNPQVTTKQRQPYMNKYYNSFTSLPYFVQLLFSYIPEITETYLNS